MTDNIRQAKTYLAAWQARDADAIRATLHPEVSFRGPLTAFEGRDAVMASFEPLLPMLKGLTVRDVLAESGRAIAVYDFDCHEPVGSVRMADLMTFENGRLRSIEMFFDPRPFLMAMADAAG